MNYVEILFINKTLDLGDLYWRLTHHTSGSRPEYSQTLQPCSSSWNEVHGRRK